MSVPKQRHTKARSDRKRFQYVKEMQVMQACPACKAAIMPHRVCPSCGSYKGRRYVDTVKSKLGKQAEA